MSSIKRILCKKIPERHRPVELDETEATHATRVLRLKEGDLVEAMDGKGHSAIVRLRTRQGPSRLEFMERDEAQIPRFESEPKSSGLQRVPLILEMAVLKGEAMEWVVEKAVELGIQKLVPVLTAHTVVQMDRKGPEAFQERWQKIADQALKQCGRLERLEVKLPKSLEQLVSEKVSGARIWCDERERGSTPALLSWLETERSKNHSPVHLLVGPEGGWSQKERDFLSLELGETFVCTSLGPLVLRAETAALFAASLVAADLRLRIS